jgi:hypothetical protein
MRLEGPTTTLLPLPFVGEGAFSKEKHEQQI